MDNREAIKILLEHGQLPTTDRIEKLMRSASLFTPSKINSYIERGYLSNREKYELLCSQNWKCKHCGQRLKFKKEQNFEGCEVAHFDHIIPLKKAAEIGFWEANDSINWQALCPKCNLTKHTSLSEYDALQIIMRLRNGR